MDFVIINMDKIKIRRCFMLDIQFTVSFCTFFSEKEKFEFEVEKYSDNVLFCLLKGRFTYGFSSVNPSEFTAKAGDIVLCKKGEYLYRQALEPISMCMIKFKSDDEVFTSGSPITAEDYTRLTHNLQMLECIHFITEPAAGLTTEHFCRDIIYQVIYALTASRSPLMHAYMFINSHFCEDISIEALAKTENFSVAHFINLFKDAYKKTPKGYITELRMKKAFYLLKNSSKNISETAYMCGYKDALYFSKHFKKYYGFSPIALREQNVN